jgi:hypothetical protein
VEFLPKDLERARRLAIWGVCGAAYNVVANGAFALDNFVSSPRVELGASIVHVVGALLFVVVAYGVYRMSRIAAAFLLLLTIAYQLGLIIRMHQIPSVIHFLLLLAAINGARGVFGYQRARARLA